jgi:hypothetical protein
MTILLQGDRRFARLIQMGELVRRDGVWRFGTKRIADHVVQRLAEANVIAIDGDRARATPSVE